MFAYMYYHIFTLYISLCNKKFKFVTSWNLVLIEEKLNASVYLTKLNKLEKQIGVAMYRTKQTSESTLVETNKTNLRAQQRISKRFDPLLITHLDLSFLNTCQREVFLTGCLPEWIQNFSNLTSLSAMKLGIIILEPWLLNLTHLTVLDLGQNQITTWPDFLSNSKSLDNISLDGNPCLEKAFEKSPTLRSFYFSWKPSSDDHKAIPTYIRGPEWPVAAAARASTNANVNDLGFFCGGIYTLAVKPDEFEDGFLTPVEPNQLILRKRCFKDNTADIMAIENKRYLHTKHNNAMLYKGEGKRQAQLILEILDDITRLKSATGRKRYDHIEKFVPLVGSMNDKYNQLLKKSLIPMTPLEVHHFYPELLAEEEHYIEQLKLAQSEFYYNRKIKSNEIINCFRDVFSGFPALYAIHSKAILPALRNFAMVTDEMISSRYRRKLSGDTMKNSIKVAIADLCTAFRKLQLVMKKNAENLWLTEDYLNIATAPTIMYRDNEFKAYVEKQVLACRGGEGRVEVDLYEHKLYDWICEQSHKKKKRPFQHDCVDFVYLPLIRLARYERVFTSLSATNKAYHPIQSVLRRMREAYAIKVECSRMSVRMSMLSNKFKVQPSYFQNYRWDAVLTVHSRGYFEQGILALNNNDVLDENDTPVSYVKEVFPESRLRVLRMVKCGHDIFILDEIFEQLVCKTHRSNIATLRGKHNLKQCMSVVFLDVKEICVVQVRNFNARYFARHDPNRELWDALNSKTDKKIL